MIVKYFKDYISPNIFKFENKLLSRFNVFIQGKKLPLKILSKSLKNNVNLPEIAVREFKLNNRLRGLSIQSFNYLGP